jgi:alpha-galactosidase
MNSVSYGWWLDGLYQFNDPDIMVFGNGSDLNEMQSRLISGPVTGLMLDGDDLTSVAGQTGAQACLSNLAFDSVARTGHTFTPVEGNTGSSAGSLFVRQDGATWHLAVFNYTSNPTNMAVTLSRAGLPAGYYTVSNLWDGTTMVVTGSFNASLNEKQSKLFSLRRR